MSLKASILKAAIDYKPDILKVESKLGTVFLRSMSGYALSEWQRRNREDKSFPSRGQALANCLCEEDGERIGFSELEVLELDRLDTAVTEKLLDVAFKVSGLSEEERKAAEKN
jgi:hypothetical protein